MKITSGKWLGSDDEAKCVVCVEKIVPKAGFDFVLDMCIGRFSTDFGHQFKPDPEVNNPLAHHAVLLQFIVDATSSSDKSKYGDGVMRLYTQHRGVDEKIKSKVTVSRRRRSLGSKKKKNVARKKH